MVKNKKVCVLGMGYIGLPTSALLANRGYMVHGVDVQPKVIEIINQGKIHIVEPELDTFVKSAVMSGNLIADLKPCLADIFIIAVPTPFHEGYLPNIDYVIAATKSIISYLQPGNMIILESTSPIGTTDKIAEVLIAEGVDVTTLYIAHCPERVLPGHIMRELIENDRIIGGYTPDAAEVVKQFYSTFVSGEILTTDCRTAEMAKLSENSYRDVNIAFANELSMLCDKFNINVWELIKLTNRHPRVKILQPGSGVGGHCIAVDPWFIIHAAGGDAKLMKAARLTNDYKSEWVVEKIKNAVLEFEKINDRKPLLACMGLAFKPNIDDLRESPAVHIVEKIKTQDPSIFIVEPNIEADAPFQLTPYKVAVEKADIVVLLVAHSEFKNLQLSGKIVLDFCGVSNPV